MKQKKTLIVISTFLIVLVGGTIAYFTSSASFINSLTGSKYKTTTTETFTSPDNWQPGEEIAKEVITTNEGDVTAAVRLSYTERWLNENGQGLNNNSNPAKINFQNMMDWTKVGNYYYYNYPLEPGESTSSLIKSITLDDQFGSDHYTCTTDGNVETCVSNLDGKKKGKYILTIVKETVQFDSYEKSWKTDVVIQEKDNQIKFVNRQNAGSITPGDLIKIGNQEFYVFSTNSTSTELITRYNLNVGNINTSVMEGIQDSSILGAKSGITTYGNIAFSYDHYWKDKVGNNLDYSGSLDTNLSDDYETYYNYPYPYVYDAKSNLYKYVDAYKKALEHFGITVTNTRLMNYEEALNLGCTPYGTEFIYDYMTGDSVNEKGSCTLAPAWLTETTFWLGNAPLDSCVTYISTDKIIDFDDVNGGSTTTVTNGTNSKDYKIYNRRENDNIGLRPIIEVPTSIIPA